MGRHSYAPTFTPETADAVREAAARVLADQSFFKRRKDSIVAIANGVVQLANALAVFAGQYDERVGVAVLVVAFMAQIFVHAGTRGAFTPSAAEALVAEAETRVPTSIDVLPVHAGLESPGAPARE